MRSTSPSLSRIAATLILAACILGAHSASAQSASVSGADKRFLVSAKDKYGYMDEKGSVVIAPSYADALEFSEGLAAVAVDQPKPGAKKGETERLWGYIDVKGAMVIKPAFSDAKSFSEGKAAVKTDRQDLYGYIDRSGKIVIAPAYSEASRFSSGIATVILPGSDKTKTTAWIKGDGSYLLPPKAARRSEFRDGYAIEWGSPDSNGGTVYSSAGTVAYKGEIARKDGEFGQGLFPVIIDGKLAVLNVTLGAAKALEGWDWVGDFDKEGVAPAKKDKLYGFVDRSGRTLIPPRFTNCSGGFSEGLAAVATIIPDAFMKKNIDDIVAMDLELDYKEALTGNGQAVATDDGLYGYIDKSGAWVIPPTFCKAKAFRDGIARVNEDRYYDDGFKTKACFIDRKGALVRDEEALNLTFRIDMAKGAQRIYADGSDPGFAATDEGLRIKPQGNGNDFIKTIGVYGPGTGFYFVVKPMAAPGTIQDNFAISVKGEFGEIGLMVAAGKYVIAAAPLGGTARELQGADNKLSLSADLNSLSLSVDPLTITFIANGQVVLKKPHGFNLSGKLMRCEAGTIRGGDVILKNVNIYYYPVLPK